VSCFMVLRVPEKPQWRGRGTFYYIFRAPAKGVAIGTEGSNAAHQPKSKSWLTNALGLTPTVVRTFLGHGGSGDFGPHWGLRVAEWKARLWGGVGVTGGWVANCGGG